MQQQCYEEWFSNGYNNAFNNGKRYNNEELGSQSVDPGMYIIDVNPIIYQYWYFI